MEEAIYLKKQVSFEEYHYQSAVLREVYLAKVA